MIKVLFLQSQSFFGADTAIQARLMRHLDRRAVSVHVACTTAGEGDLSARRRIHAIPNVRILPTDFGPSMYGLPLRTRIARATTWPRAGVSLLAVARYIKREGIDVIHGTEKPRDAVYGVLLAKLAGARSLVHMHVAYGEWQSVTVRWALRHADAIVAVSRFAASSIVAAGYPPNRVFPVYNALDLSETRWEPTLDASATRRALGLPPGEVVVGIVSRLYKWKGHHDLIAALALVARETPNVTLVIVGEDDTRAHPTSESYRGELEAQLRALGLGKKVVFTGFRTDIPELMASFDIFAHPSWEEPFGMVFLEAMAMAKPVVAWNSGAAPEVISHGETGLLVERGRVPELAEAIVRLARDGELRRRLGENGRERVQTEFTPRRMCEAMTAVYRATLGLAPDGTPPAWDHRRA